MIDTQAIKDRLVELAITGSLVPQNIEDGTGEDFYKEITNERQRHKKNEDMAIEQNLLDINAPTIPSTWKWVYLYEIADVITGSTPSKTQPSYYGATWPFFKPANIGTDKYLSDAYEKLSDEGIKKARLIPSGSVAVSCIGNIGKSAMLQEDGATNQQINSICNYPYMDYIYWVCQSNIFVKQLRNQASATVISIVNKSKMECCIVPLPPLKEQKRIVKQLEAIFNVIELIDDLQKQYANNISSLNKKILDLAIMGKLVPQDPSDEPASVLLQKIAEEKQKLIKEGKISKSRTRYDFEDSDTPFVVPDTWGWARLGDICFDLKYGTSSKSSKTGEMIVIRMGNIQNGEIDYSDLVYSSNEADNEKYALKPLDILFNRTNSNELVGKTGIYRGQHKAIFAGYLVLIRPIGMNPEYLNYVMNSEYEKAYCIAVKSDSVNQANVNATKIGQFLIPIPPRKEQDRIVKMIKNTLNEIRNSNYSPQKSEWERIRK